MSDSKIQIKVGIIEFSGEGDQDWLANQLDKIFAKIPELLKIEQTSPPKGMNTDNAGVTNNGHTSEKPANLVTYLKDKNATSNQVKKFLATSAYLQLNGKERLSTSDVSNTLKDAKQTKLSNASDCLNQNIKKGHCEKDGAKQFFVTSNGFTELGIVE